jgi:hypothetical protein
VKALIKLAVLVLMLELVGASPAFAQDAVSQPVCNVQPAGNIITPFMADRINGLSHLYKEAAAAKNVSWLLLPPLHYREFALRRDNPANGQGIYQLYSLTEETGIRFKPSPGVIVADPEFVRQSKLALDHLILKAPRGKLRSESDVAWAYFGYNGRAPAYYRQARRLGYQHAFEGSPYVYNLFDAEHTGKLFVIKHDGGRLTDELDNRPGAFTIYYELLRQCQPDRVPEAKESSPTTEKVPDKAPDPFRGEAVPRLPAEGQLPFPWFAFSGCALGAAVIASFRYVLRFPMVIMTWALASVLAPFLVRFDDLTLQSWPFLSKLTLGRGVTGILAFAVMLLLMVGLLQSLEEFARTRNKPKLAGDTVRWAGKWLARHWQAVGICGSIACWMVVTYRVTARDNPAEAIFTLKAMLMMAATALAATFVMQRVNSQPAPAANTK